MQQYHFRPSARIIATIGEDIIKDMHAAVVEMVKNAYDADAHNVHVIFRDGKDDGILIGIKDDGHGMSNDTIVNRWLVPATNDKLKRKKSPMGRRFQGRKGIGRFAVAVLGEKVSINTIHDGEKTKVLISWEDFSQEKFLDEVDIDVTTEATDDPNGTTFRIKGSAAKRLQWDDNQLDCLIKELRKLITPMASNSTEHDSDQFEVELDFSKFSSSKHAYSNVTIKPYPLTDYFDYRLIGWLYPDASYQLTFTNSQAGKTEDVNDLFFAQPKDEERLCHKVFIDFRVFDRDPEAIERLASHKELFKEEHIAKNEARRLLDDVCGVSIYRNGFRIRPYGDSDNDWLMLDKRRVQTPTMRIGANQIAGYIVIGDEEESRLVEKSARDGLREDSHYRGLISMLLDLLSLIESRRYAFRKKAGIGRKSYSFTKEFNALTDFSEVKKNVSTILLQAQTPVARIEEVQRILDIDAESKVVLVEKLERELSLYRGQATLGKVMDVVMHEARKPIAWLRNQTSTLRKAYARYEKTKDPSIIDKMIRILSESQDQLDIIANLLNRLNPLATRRESSISLICLGQVIDEALGVFNADIKRAGIEIKRSEVVNATLLGWKIDLLTALTNILENALYWVCTRDEGRLISILVDSTEGELTISISNNGPRILKHMLEADSLFDPGISAKPDGTGLGLPIAGEAVTRNKGKLSAVDIEDGACFLMTFTNRGDDTNEQ